MAMPQSNSLFGRVKLRKSDNSGSDAVYSGAENKSGEMSSHDAGVNNSSNNNPLSNSFKGSNKLNLRLVERKGE